MSRFVLVVLVVAFFLSVPLPDVMADTPDFKFYGFVRSDTYYDSGSNVGGEWLLYSRSEDDPAREEGVFSMSARHSRIGVKIGGMETANGKLMALIEADFAGGFANSSTSQRQPVVRLRHAWIGYSTDTWDLRIGQDWALMSAPFPRTASFVVGGAFGNLWMRYPQMRATYKADKLHFTAALTRPMAGNVKYDAFAQSDLDPVFDGERTGLPWVMGRIDYKGDGIEGALYGHYGEEDATTGNGSIVTVESFSFGGYVGFSGKRFSTRVSGFSGENLNSFFGGIIQGIVTYPQRVETIATVGGWADLTYTINKRWACTAGVGMDDPDVEEFNNASARDLNRWIWGMVAWTPVKPVKLMLEVDHVRTEYFDMAAGENLRGLFVAVYSF